VVDVGLGRAGEQRVLAHEAKTVTEMGHGMGLTVAVSVGCENVFWIVGH
jgi:hypothetical protein